MERREWLVDLAVWAALGLLVRQVREVQRASNLEQRASLVLPVQSEHRDLLVPWVVQVAQVTRGQQEIRARQDLLVGQVSEVSMEMCPELRVLLVLPDLLAIQDQSETRVQRAASGLQA